MNPGPRSWLAETHHANFELVRHFLARFFDSELATAPGQWRKGAVGVVAGLLPAALLLYPMFVHRYGCVAIRQPSYACPAIADYAAAYSRLVRTDTAWLISLAICVTALVTALLWQSLFPSRRDCLALAALPVSQRQIFAAKFTALLAAFTVFVVALNLLPAALYAQVITSPWQTNSSVPLHAAATFAAMACGCAFAFFSLLALQGVMLMILPARLFARIAVVAQAVLFTLSVAALPFLWREPPASAWWPPNWFLGLRDSAFRPALLALGLPAACALLAYLAS